MTANRGHAGLVAPRSAVSGKVIVFGRMLYLGTSKAPSSAAFSTALTQLRRNRIDEITGAKGTYRARDHLSTASLPRNARRIAVEGWPMQPLLPSGPPVISSVTLVAGGMETTEKGVWRNRSAPAGSGRKPSFGSSLTLPRKAGTETPVGARPVRALDSEIPGVPATGPSRTPPSLATCPAREAR